MVRTFQVTDPAPSAVRNLIGFHLLPGTPNTFLDMLRQLHAADRPMPFVLLGFITDGRRAFDVRQIREASPHTQIVARIFTGVDYSANDKGGWDKTTKLDGRAYFEQNKGLITADIASADWVQIRDLNEPGEGTHINDWMHGILDGADAFKEHGRNGIKLAIYNFSVGNPGLPGDVLDDGKTPRPYRDFWKWPATHDLLRRVKRDGHLVGLHQYAFNGNFSDESRILRHRRILQYLPADLQDVPIGFTETGEGYLTFAPPRTPQRYAIIFPSLNNSLQSLRGMRGGAMWSLGDSGGWSVDRLEHVMGVYFDWAMTLPTRTALMQMGAIT